MLFRLDLGYETLFLLSFLLSASFVAVFMCVFTCVLSLSVLSDLLLLGFSVSPLNSRLFHYAQHCMPGVFEIGKFQFVLHNLQPNDRFCLLISMRTEKKVILPTY